jgi:NADP-dependent aldehyde dehydrogenase
VAAGGSGRPDTLLEECFGPVTVLVRYSSEEQLHAALRAVPGSLTATLHSEPGDDVAETLGLLQARAGRVLFAGWPTGVAVTWSQQHGGPWPATTSLHTSVGATAIRRFLRPVTYQSAPQALLPEVLRDESLPTLPHRRNGVLVLP